MNQFVITIAVIIILIIVLSFILYWRNKDNNTVISAEKSAEKPEEKSAEKPAPKPEEKSAEKQYKEIVSADQEIFLSHPNEIYLIVEKNGNKSEFPLLTTNDTLYKDIIRNIHTNIFRIYLENDIDIRFVNFRIIAQAGMNILLSLRAKNENDLHKLHIYGQSGNEINFPRVDMVTRFPPYTYLPKNKLPILLVKDDVEYNIPINLPVGFQSYLAYQEIIRDAIKDNLTFNGITISTINHLEYRIEGADNIIVDRSGELFANYGINTYTPHLLSFTQAEMFAPLPKQ